jgi:hypothetical protein
MMEKAIGKNTLGDMVDPGTKAYHNAWNKLQVLVGDQLTADQYLGTQGQRHIKELAKLPSNLLMSLSDRGVSWHVGDKTIGNYEPMLNGMQPRGYTQTTDYGSLAGSYLPDKMKVLLGASDYGSSSASIAQHETGHAVGHNLGFNWDKDLIDLHKATYDRLPPYMQQDGPGGYAGREEMLAEMFARFHNRKRKLLSGPAQEYIQSITDNPLKMVENGGTWGGVNSLGDMVDPNADLAALREFMQQSSLESKLKGRTLGRRKSYARETGEATRPVITDETRQAYRDSLDEKINALKGALERRSLGDMASPAGPHELAAAKEFGLSASAYRKLRLSAIPGSADESSLLQIEKRARELQTAGPRAEHAVNRAARQARRAVANTVPGTYTSEQDTAMTARQERLIEGMRAKGQQMAASVAHFDPEGLRSALDPTVSSMPPTPLGDRKVITLPRIVLEEMRRAREHGTFDDYVKSRGNLASSYGTGALEMAWQQAVQGKIEDIRIETSPTPATLKRQAAIKAAAEAAYEKQLVQWTKTPAHIEGKEMYQSVMAHAAAQAEQMIAEQTSPGKAVTPPAGTTATPVPHEVAMIKSRYARAVQASAGHEKLVYGDRPNSVSVFEEDATRSRKIRPGVREALGEGIKQAILKAEKHGISQEQARKLIKYNETHFARLDGGARARSYSADYNFESGSVYIDHEGGMRIHKIPVGPKGMAHGVEMIHVHEGKHFGDEVWFNEHQYREASPKLQAKRARVANLIARMEATANTTTAAETRQAVLYDYNHNIRFNSDGSRRLPGKRAEIFAAETRARIAERVQAGVGEYTDLQKSVNRLSVEGSLQMRELAGKSVSTDQFYAAADASLSKLETTLKAAGIKNGEIDYHAVAGRKRFLRPETPMSAIEALAADAEAKAGGGGPSIPPKKPGRISTAIKSLTDKMGDRFDGAKGAVANLKGSIAEARMGFDYGLHNGGGPGVAGAAGHYIGNAKEWFLADSDEKAAEILSERNKHMEAWRVLGATESTPSRMPTISERYASIMENPHFRQFMAGGEEVGAIAKAGGFAKGVGGMVLIGLAMAGAEKGLKHIGVSNTTASDTVGLAGSAMGVQFMNAASESGSLSGQFIRQRLIDKALQYTPEMFKPAVEATGVASNVAGRALGTVGLGMAVTDAEIGALNLFGDFQHWRGKYDNQQYKDFRTDTSDTSRAVKSIITGGLYDRISLSKEDEERERRMRIGRGILASQGQSSFFSYSGAEDAYSRREQQKATDSSIVSTALLQTPLALLAGDDTNLPLSGAGDTSDPVANFRRVQRELDRVRGTDKTAVLSSGITRNSLGSFLNGLSPEQQAKLTQQGSSELASQLKDKFNIPVDDKWAQVFASAAGSHPDATPSDIIRMLAGGEMKSDDDVLKFLNSVSGNQSGPFSDPGRASAALQSLDVARSGTLQKLTGGGLTGPTFGGGMDPNALLQDSALRSLLGGGISTAGFSLGSADPNAMISPGLDPSFGSAVSIQSLQAQHKSDDEDARAAAMEELAQKIGYADEHMTQSDSRNIDAMLLIRQRKAERESFRGYRHGGGRTLSNGEYVLKDTEAVVYPETTQAEMYDYLRRQMEGGPDVGDALTTLAAGVMGRSPDGGGYPSSMSHDVSGHVRVSGTDDFVDQLASAVMGKLQGAIGGSAPAKGERIRKGYER